MAPAAVDTTDRRPKPAVERIGPYEIEQRLGSGGMANVYKVRDEHGEVLALKELRAPGGSRSEMLRRFRAEFEVTRRLEHPNIVAVRDYFSADKTVHIVMEYVDGLDLRELSKRLELLPDGILAMLGAQIASALGHAHSQGVLHRDMKPENVLLARTGAVKVADFGVARVAGTRLTTTGIIVGSPAYMSPEQLAGVPGQDLTIGTDIYALGVMLYELGEGKDPLGLKRSQDLLEVLKLKREKAPRRFTRLRDPDLQALLLRCLATEPEHRPENMTDVEQLLRRVARRHGVRPSDLQALAQQALDPSLTPAPARRRSSRNASPAEAPAPETAKHRALGPAPYHPPAPVSVDLDAYPDPPPGRLHSSELQAPGQDVADPEGHRERTPKPPARVAEASFGKARGAGDERVGGLAWLAIGLFVLSVVFLGASSALTGSPLGLLEALVPAP
jgi:serine/threonine-protein kinase